MDRALRHSRATRYLNFPTVKGWYENAAITQVSGIGEVIQSCCC